MAEQIRKEYVRKENLRSVKKKASYDRFGIADDLATSNFEADQEPCFGQNYGEERSWPQRGTDRNEEKERDEQPIRWKGRYVLGRGTLGEVILGMDLETHKLMAVKEIDLGKVHNCEQTVSTFHSGNVLTKTGGLNHW